MGLVSALIRAEHRHVAYLARHLDLPITDTLALYHLANEPLRSLQLAERLGLTPGSATTLVDRLQSRDLARCCADPCDRRVVLVELTPAGRAETWHALQTFIGDVIRLGAGSTASQGRAIHRFLGRLIEAIDADTQRLQGP